VRGGRAGSGDKLQVAGSLVSQGGQGGYLAYHPHRAVDDAQGAITAGDNNWELGREQETAILDRTAPAEHAVRGADGGGGSQVWHGGELGGLP
jgi:hypothetical protein